MAFRHRTCSQILHAMPFRHGFRRPTYAETKGRAGVLQAALWRKAWPGNPSRVFTRRDAPIGRGCHLDRHRAACARFTWTSLLGNSARPCRRAGPPNTPTTRFLGVRCHSFDFSDMVRPDEDGADLRAFLSMTQRRPFSCLPKRPIRDAEMLSEETAAPRTGSWVESQVENSTSMGSATFIFPTAPCCQIHTHNF